jgi:hypothetical protein
MGVLAWQEALGIIEQETVRDPHVGRRAAVGVIRRFTEFAASLVQPSGVAAGSGCVVVVMGETSFALVR